jgi:hypothetical protein
LSNSFAQSLPQIIKNNYDFLEKEEALIIEKYHNKLTKNVEDVLTYNNYAISGNLINILELIEQSNLSNSKSSINNDFLRYIDMSEYGKASEFFRAHLTRSLTVNESDFSNIPAEDSKKYDKYLLRRSHIKSFLTKKKLI